MRVGLVALAQQKQSTSGHGLNGLIMTAIRPLYKFFGQTLIFDGVDDSWGNLTCEFDLKILSKGFEPFKGFIIVYQIG